jgi:hypothetical protein
VQPPLPPHLWVAAGLQLLPGLRVTGVNQRNSEYETHIRPGGFVLIAFDSQEAADRAMRTLEATRHQGIERFAVQA